MEGSTSSESDGSQPADDMSGLAVFDPGAADTWPRQLIGAKSPDHPPTEFPELMTPEAVDMAVEARWRKQQALEGSKEKPDPWAIIERAFPRIAAAIRDQWGRRALDDYFSKLVVDDRGGRQGFPPDVLSAIMEISRLHAAQHRFRRPVCPWEADVRETKWWSRR